MARFDEGFACDVLTDKTLKSLLEKKHYLHYQKVKNHRAQMSQSLCKAFAKAIKRWSKSIGATHHAHCFVCLDNTLRFKRISFCEVGKNNQAFFKFDAADLVGVEVDLSSLPNGGSQTCHKARGNAVWNPFLQPFALNDDFGGKTVFLPSFLCDKNGSSMCTHLPLERALRALDRYGSKFLQLTTGSDCGGVECSLGIEQEYYFLSECEQKELNNYLLPMGDLVANFGGKIESVLNKIGICTKVQHSEVGTNQYEIVPQFCRANKSCFDNIILVWIMKKLAAKQNLKISFDEKPCQDQSGSGKHNNWSIWTRSGKNLFEKTHFNAEIYDFVFACTMAAIDIHSDLISLAAACRGNEKRFGQKEAPTGVVSVCTEQKRKYNRQKAAFYSDFCFDKFATKKYFGCDIVDLGVDRNRTSPIVFTKNKFEFRHIGASQNCAFLNTVLATIMAEQFKEACEVLEKREDKKAALIELAKQKRDDHKRIVFCGNCYGRSWKITAKKRGLFEEKSCLKQYDNFLSEKNISLFKQFNVLSIQEMKTLQKEWINQYNATDQKI